MVSPSTPRAKNAPAAIQLLTALSLPPRDAWNSLGKMSRRDAMSAYISEMKLVAQKVGRAGGRAVELGP